MNDVKNYYEIYQKLELLGLSKTKIAKCFGCSRTTVNNIIKKINIDKLDRVETLYKNKDFITTSYLDQYDKLKELTIEYEKLISANPRVDFTDFFKAFSYPKRYLNKDTEHSKNSNLQEFVAATNIHMYNFHMRYNPYYYIFRGYFQKESRPLIDFNIDFDSNEIVDIKVQSLSSAKFNTEIIRKNYDMDYKVAFNNVFNYIQNKDKSEQNSGFDLRLKERQMKFIKDNCISIGSDVSMDRLSYENFIDLMYVFSLGYSDNHELRFLVYEDTKLDRFKYMEKHMKSSKYKKRLHDIRFYNVARLFNIDNRYEKIEDVLCNYNFDQLSGDGYIKKIYTDVGFRISELDKLIVMVSGIGMKLKDFEWMKSRRDDEDDKSVSIEENRKTEIMRIRRG